MGELSDVINEETPTYTFGGLMADIGGAMGLLLGLRKGSKIFCLENAFTFNKCINNAAK